MTHAITSARNTLFRPIAGFSENGRRRIASRQVSHQLAHLNGHTQAARETGRDGLPVSNVMKVGQIRLFQSFH